MRQGGDVDPKPGKKEISGARHQANRARCADQIGFDGHRLRVPFLLRMLRCRDVFAKVTRMVAVESLRDSLG